VYSRVYGGSAALCTVGVQQCGHAGAEVSLTSAPSEPAAEGLFRT